MGENERSTSATRTQLVWVIGINVVWYFLIFVPHTTVFIRSFARSPLENIAGMFGALIIPIGLSYIIATGLQSKYNGHMFRKWIIANFIILSVATLGIMRERYEIY